MSGITQSGNKISRLNRRDAMATSAGGLLAMCGWQHALGQTTAGRIKVGQIGTGHAHATKMSVYRTSPDYEVVGIVEPNAELQAKAKSNAAYRDLPWMTEEELLGQGELQVVLVETEVAQLLDVAERCIAAGKHIHLDKPAGASLPQLQRIVADALKRKRMIQMGYMYRYNPAIVLLHEFLDKGWLGDVFEIHAVMSKVVDARGRAVLAQQPGGTMFELGCHLIDLVVGVLGKPQSIASFNKRSGKHDDALVDNMLAVLDYKHATASIKSSAVEVEGFSRRHFVVCGTEGTFHVQPLDRPSARVALSKSRGEYTRGYQDVEFPQYERYVADAADMVSVLRGEKSNAFSYAHDLSVQESVLRASGLPID
ncbi:MAG: Gfo/Idh/MocA family oxidoreductase [Pirellulaceae bacterium]